MSDVPKKTADRWSKVFPPNLDTRENEASYVKRLFYVTFSHYMRCRKLVPAEAFRKCRLGDATVYIFANSSPLSILPGQLLRNVCQSLDKGFVKHVHMIVTPANDRGTALEQLTFSLLYGPDNNNGGRPLQLSVSLGEKRNECRIDFSNIETTNEAIVEMLKRLTHACKVLLDFDRTVRPHICVDYYDNVPSDYNPDGFAMLENGTADFQWTSRGSAEPPQEFGVTHEAGICTASNGVWMNLRSCYIADTVGFEARVESDMDVSFTSVNESMLDGGDH